MSRVVALIFSLFCIFSTSALALTDMAGVVGIQTTDVSVDSPLSANSGTGLSTGVLGFVEIAEPSYIRVGAILSQRRFEIESNNVNNELETVYLEAPITYLEMLTENIGIYGGGRIGLKMQEQDCTLNSQSCPGSDLNSIIYGAEIGAHLLMNDQYGAEASFVYGLSEIADDVNFDSSIILYGFYIF